MVLTAIADEHLSKYIHNISQNEPCSIGLILGQITASKLYVLHFAKTPQLHGDTQDREKSIANIKSINEINEPWIAEHANHATRLLPGGIYILGIFVVSNDDLLTPLSPKIKTLLSAIHKQLGNNKYLKGNPDNNNEKLILNYCTKTTQYTCKSYDVNTASAKPVQFKFVTQELSKWHEIECYYDLDQVITILETEKDLPLKKHMAVIIKSMDEALQSAVFLYNGEMYDGDTLLESFLKRNSKSKSKMITENENKPIQATILVQCDNKKAVHVLEIKNTAGHIKLTGQIGCKLWLHPKATVIESSHAIKDDLLRSLTARLEMHWDSLIEEEHGSPEDTSSIHEPPRRVLVTLPKSNITLSDYLFPGEGPQEAQISLEELLDIKVNEKDAIKDIEGQADLAEIYNEGLEADSEEVLPKLPTDTNKFMYTIGLAVALLVLIVSLLLHYLN